jgi:hypothetical protein
VSGNREEEGSEEGDEEKSGKESSEGDKRVGKRKGESGEDIPINRQRKANQTKFFQVPYLSLSETEKSNEKK